MITRRNLLRGLIAAPAIIPIHNLMRLAPQPKFHFLTLAEYADLTHGDTRNLLETMTALNYDLAIFGTAFSRYHNDKLERLDPATMHWAYGPVRRL